MDKLNITLEEDQRIYFSSDQHFQHRNILRFCNRPFSDTKEMEEALISNWNEVVRQNDIGVILGDMCWFESRHDIKKITSKLNGKTIYIVPGNHCTRKSYELCDERIILLDDISVIYLRKENSNKIIKEIFLSHCPLMTWPHREGGAINLFGHIHSGPLCNNIIDADLPLWKGLQYDVGVDNNNYYPVSLEKILRILNNQIK